MCFSILDARGIVVYTLDEKVQLLACHIFKIGDSVMKREKQALLDEYDVILIGAGMGGLVCSNHLAKQGRKVLLIEKHMIPGGYLTGFYRKGFYFEEYIAHPDHFESNLDRYLSHLNMLVHTSYWDKRYPRMVTRAMVRRLSALTGSNG